MQTVTNAYLLDDVLCHLKKREGYGTEILLNKTWMAVCYQLNLYRIQPFF